MCKKNILFAAILALGVTSFTISYADDEGPALSFNKPDVYTSIDHSIEIFSDWARGEYAEHHGEGLFDKHSEDGEVIKDTLSVVDELKKLAAQAESRGDVAMAHAYLFSAEATARYAAVMPHMLEARISHHDK